MDDISTESEEKYEWLEKLIEACGVRLLDYQKDILKYFVEKHSKESENHHD